VRLPSKSVKTYHVYHLYVIRSNKRDQLKEHLSTNEIEVAIHYPTALPFLKAYAYLQHAPEQFPIAYNETNQILSIPMYPELTLEQVEFISAAINTF
jgi:dTDP-4-amino-4,6-dideoxygalactose transaminase